MKINSPARHKNFSSVAEAVSNQIGDADSKNSKAYQCYYKYGKVFIVFVVIFLLATWYCHPHHDEIEEYNLFIEKLKTVKSVSDLDDLQFTVISPKITHQELEAIPLWSSRRPEPMSADVKQCESVPTNLRFDCHPDRNPNPINCVRRGCCWDSSKRNGKAEKHLPLDTPYCFYPSNYTIYNFSDIHQSNDGATAKLHQKVASGFPDDNQLLSFEAHFLDCTMLRIKVHNTARKNWESPLPRIKKQFEKCPEAHRLYTLDLIHETDDFVIRRSNTRTPVFDTRSAAPLISSRQYLQLSTFLSSPYIYGLGQHLDGLLLNINWKRRVLWNVDQWNIPNSNLYGSHPFYMVVEESGFSHGVFLLNSNAMDVTLQPTPALTFHVTGGIIDLFVFLGPNPSQVVEQYMQIVGKPFLPPYWSLGYHQCRYGCTDLEKTKQIYERTKRAKIPFDVQWNDIDYMKNRNDFTYDSNTYGGLPDFVQHLHEEGMHYVVINDAAVGAGESPGSYPPYDDGLKKDVFIKNSSGDPFVGKVWNLETSVWPDFTNPSAVKYWVSWLKKFHDQIPYDGLWLDMNEPSNFWSGQQNGCPKSSLNDPPYSPAVIGDKLYYKTVCPTARHFWGSHYNVHNLYGLTGVIATNHALRLIRQDQRPFIISRSTFPGSGSVGGHWTGDVVSDWFNLHRSIGDILTMGIHGIPMVGADICGFNGNTTVNLCNRWMQLGAFYPFSRNHNTDDAKDQDPVAMGDVVVESSRTALLIRYSLLPYLYSLFFRAYVSGTPVIKPLFADYAEDRQTLDIDTQFLWGEALMINPVLQENTFEVKAYFPNGRWFDWYDKHILTEEGRHFQVLPAPPTRIPLAIKAGHIIPMQEPDVTTTKSRKKPFGLLVALDRTGSASGFMFWDDGDSIDPHSREDYLQFNFTCSHRKLSIYSKIRNWTPPEKMVLGSFEVLGVPDPVSRVTINKDSVAFEYNIVSKTLVVKNLHVDLLTGSFTATWEYAKHHQKADE